MTHDKYIKKRKKYIFPTILPSFRLKVRKPLEPYHNHGMIFSIFYVLVKYFTKLCIIAGTSAAAPLAAGIIALALQVHSSMKFKRYGSIIGRPTAFREFFKSFRSISVKRSEKFHIFSYVSERIFRDIFDQFRLFRLFPKFWECKNL